MEIRGNDSAGPTCLSPTRLDNGESFRRGKGRGGRARADGHVLAVAASRFTEKKRACVEVKRHRGGGGGGVGHLGMLVQGVEESFGLHSSPSLYC